MKRTNTKIIFPLLCKINILRNNINNISFISYFIHNFITDISHKYHFLTKSQYNYITKVIFCKEKNLTKDYKLILDIHRDSLRHKYTLYEKDNKKYARILFIIGASNKDYKKNKLIADNLNTRLNNEYKGISRGVTLREDISYNQDLNNKIILIKIGGIDSTLEEVNNTMEVLAKIISDYIKES